MSLSDNTAVNIGIGIGIFVGGNLTAFAISLLQKRGKNSRSREIEVLTDQIKELKKQIDELNKTLHDNLDGLRKDIAAIPSDRKSRGALSVWSFKTACSDDEDDNGPWQMSPVQESGANGIQKAISNEEKKRLFYGKIDELYAGPDEDKENAMRMLQDNEINYKDDWEFLWRLGRSHISIHEMRELAEEKKTHALASLRYTESALKIYEPSADVHKWHAIALGTMTDYLPTKEKITNGFKLKDHILRALELSPSDATLHFMMGRWCYGVYMLSWVERKLAATLFATPPQSTVEDALKYFEKAEEINRGFYKANQLYIAKCHYEKSEYDRARAWLVSAQSLPIVNGDDEKSHQEVVALLAKV